MSVRAVPVSVTPRMLEAGLDDGRTIAAPLAWFPRLGHGTEAERSHARLVGQGEGLHWPDLDEDVSVEALLAGRPSVESSASLKRWLAGRGTGRPHRRRTGIEALPLPASLLSVDKFGTQIAMTAP